MPSETRDKGSDKPATPMLGGLRIADIGVDELGVAEGARRRCPGFGIDIRDGDTRAFGDVALGDRMADAMRPAGHDRDLVLQPHAALRVPPEA